MRQVVLDTETTGLDWRRGHRVIEIGCIEVVNRRITGEQFQAHVNPHREVDPEAYAVHGLSDEFLRDQPDFSEIAQAWFAFVQGAELVIHNAEFDVGFLNAEIKLLADPSKLLQDMCEIHDTLDLARRLHPGKNDEGGMRVCFADHVRFWDALFYRGHCLLRDTLESKDDGPSPRPYRRRPCRECQGETASRRHEPEVPSGFAK